MRSHLTSLLFVLLHVSSMQAQATRSVVPVFNPAGIERIILDLSGDVEILSAPGQLVQVETEVVITNGGDPILKALILAKRYSLDNSREGESLHLFYPRRLAPVSVRGTTLDEQIRYRIYLPEGLEAVMKERAAATSVPE